MKKGLYIPNYKETGSVSMNGKPYSILVVAALATIIVFAGIALGSFTGYGVLERFPVGPAKSDYYSTNWQTNRGTNPVAVIKINPDKVIAGGEIYVTVDPGLKGVWTRAKVYYWGPNIDSVKAAGEGVLKDNNVKELANERPDSTERGGFEAFDIRTFRYQTDSGWSEGRYAMCVFDYQFNGWICEPFIIFRFNERSEDINSFDFSKSILNQGK